MNRDNQATNTTIIWLSDKLLEVSPPGEALPWRITRAQAFSNLRNHSAVVDEYSRILALEPDYPNALMNRGYTYTVLKEDTDLDGDTTPKDDAAKKALRDLDEYLKLDPNSTLAYQNKAIALGQMRDYKGAESSINKAIEVFKRRSNGTFSDNEISEDIQRATGFEVIFADEPSLFTALHYHLANLEAFQGQTRFDQTLTETDRRRPKSLDAYFSAVNWAWLHMKKRPEDYGGLVSQGALWERAGYAKEARDSYGKFLEAYKQHYDKRYDNLAIWVKQELRKPALQNGGKEKEDARILGLRATAWERAKPEYAEELLTQALEQEPDNVDLLIHRATVRNTLRKFPGSKADAKKALSVAPDSPMVYLYRGLASENEEDKKGDFRKVLEFDPLNDDALVRLSDLEEESNPKLALSLLDRAIKLSPQAAWLYSKKAVLQNKQHTKQDSEAALKSIQKAIGLDSQNLDYYDERADIERSLTNDKTQAIVHRAAGYGEVAALKLRRGQTAEALDLYGRCLNILTAKGSNTADTTVQSQLAAVMRHIAAIVEERDGSKAKASEYLKTRFANRPELQNILEDELDRLAKRP